MRAATGQASIGKQHVVVELLALAQLFDAWNFLSEHRVRCSGAEEIGRREIAVVAVGVLGLNDGRASPGSGFAWVEFGGSHELCITSAVRPFGKALHRNTEQTLAQEHDEALELIVAQVFVGKLHVRTGVLFFVVQRINQ